MTEKSTEHYKVRLVENSVERVARMLSQQYNINVVWKAGECHTDGRTITLPTIPDEAPPELLDALQGYVDHETAHILYTDFNTPALKTLTKEQHMCANLIEDVRIEKALGNVFPGSPYNLKNAHDWIYSQIAANWKDITQFRRVCAAYFDYVKYGETDFWITTVDDKTKELVHKCRNAVGLDYTGKDTTDTVKAGLRMYSVLEEFVDEEKAVNKTNYYESLVSSIEDLAKTIDSKTDQVWNSDSNYDHDLDNDNTYLIYTTRYDTYADIKDVDQSEAGLLLQDLRNDALRITSTIKTKLVNSLRVATRRRWLSNKEDGKLDSKKIYKALVGANNKFYKIRTDKMELDTAIALAIDHSGSMFGSKLRLAAESAILLGDVLNVLHVPFLVYGYSTSGPREVPTDTAPFARWGSLWIRHYSDFSDSWEKGALRLTTAEKYCKENTLDGESVKYGIRRLLQRKEKRKVLLVFNDGQPYPGYGDVGRNQEYLKNVIESAKGLGIEVIAFGIQDGSVSHYYDNYVVINELSDLVKEPLIVLDKILRKGLK